LSDLAPYVAVVLFRQRFKQSALIDDLGMRDIFHRLPIIRWLQFNPDPATAKPDGLVNLGPDTHKRRQYYFIGIRPKDQGAVDNVKL